MNEKGAESQRHQSHRTKEYRGHISATDYPASMDAICHAIPPPHKQKAYNAKNNRTEACNADGTFYSPGEIRSPFFKCTDWTEQEVIPALLAQGVIKKA